MKKIKDIFYDMNDILVALIIVALAAFIIVGRIDSILAYPSTLTAEAGAEENDSDAVPNYQTPDADSEGTQNGDTEDSNTQTPDGNSDQTENPDEQSNGDGQNSNEGQGSPDSGAASYTVHIESGSTASKIADILINTGLFENRQQFYDAVAAANADTKLKAGDFLIPSNATPAEVVAILTR